MVRSTSRRGKRRKASADDYSQLVTPAFARAFLSRPNTMQRIERATDIARLASLLRERTCLLLEDAGEDDDVLWMKTVQAMDGAEDAAWTLARLYVKRQDVDDYLVAQAKATMKGGANDNA